MTDPASSDETGSKIDMDPAAAARYATDGPEAAAAAPEGPAAEKSFASKLFDGDAQGPPLQQLEAEYALGKPLALFLRGLVRLADSNGVPPVGEMAAGALLWVKQHSPDRSESGEDDEILAGDL